MIIRWIGMSLLALAAAGSGYGQTITAATLDELATSVESRVIDWRRDIHANPELGNREFRTAALVARHLESLGIEVTTGIAHTGVVGVLRGGRPGRIVALRADMDALPVTEQVDLPFASTVTTTYEGREVGVMHACGHDTHVAMLMGVAEALASVRESLPGTVMFIFQPAEEGAPTGEEGGAELMLEEGLFSTLQPDAIFALHAGSDLPAGIIGFRAGPAMASADTFDITVNGSQTHGAMPWNGIDPIVAASQIVIGTQSIISRQIDISELPAVISFGIIEGGVRTNIIPDTVRLAGTIRTYNAETQNEIHMRLARTAHSVAESVGAIAEVDIDIGYPPTINDPELARSTRQVLESALGREAVVEIPRLTAAEDFSFYANTVPGLMMTLGVRPPDVAPGEAAPNHSPLFYVDEDALVAGVRALLHASMATLRD